MVHTQHQITSWVGHGSKINLPREDRCVEAVRLVIAAGAPMLRAGLRAAVGVDDAITVVGEAADESELAAIVQRTSPDVVLSDFPTSLDRPVVRLSDEESAVAGVLPPSAGPEQLVSAIRAV